MQKKNNSQKHQEKIIFKSFVPYLSQNQSNVSVPNMGYPNLFYQLIQKNYYIPCGAPLSYTNSQKNKSNNTQKTKSNFNQGNKQSDLRLNKLKKLLIKRENEINEQILSGQHEESIGNNKKKSKCFDSQQQFEIKDEVDINEKIRKSSETKNITKNFGKGILRFINKNESMVRFLLIKSNIDQKSFFKKISQCKSNIYTIAGLRSMWIESENPFAKILRILSAQYLRKHSLSHIFNSRVQNYSKNIKYRKKILQAIQNPNEFTSIKQY